MHVLPGFKSIVRQSGPALAALIALCAPPLSASAQTDIALFPSAAATRGGNWIEIADSTAAGGRVLVHPNANAAKLKTALAGPTHYFDMTFEAAAGVPTACGCTAAQRRTTGETTRSSCSSPGL